MSISYFDLHCDTAGLAYSKNEGLYKNSLAVDFERMSRFLSPTAFFAVWVTKDEHKTPFKYVKSVVDYIHNEAYSNGNIELIHNTKEWNTDTQQSKARIFISVEGGDALEGDLENIAGLKEMGISLLTLTWNGKNEIGCGAYCDDKSGLTEFGRRVVRELENYEIVADVSHLNEEGFRDICKIANKPFIASHSNAMSLCGNERNLKDWQIKEIAGRGGIIGINIYSAFLKDSNDAASINDVIRHIDYIACIAKTENCLAIGTDFDGMSVPVIEMNDITGMNVLSEELIKSFGENTAQKVLWRNASDFLNKYNYVKD